MSDAYTFDAVVLGDRGVGSRGCTTTDTSGRVADPPVHQREEGLTEDDLVDAVAHLYSYVYVVPEATVREAARLRVEAAGTSDAGSPSTSQGCRRTVARRNSANLTPNLHQSRGGCLLSTMQHDHAPSEASAPERGLDAWDSPLPFVYCPECGMPAWVEWRDSAGSTTGSTASSAGGAAAHVKVRCFARHWFLLLEEGLTDV